MADFAVPDARTATRTGSCRQGLRALATGCGLSVLLLLSATHAGTAQQVSQTNVEPAGSTSIGTDVTAASLRRDDLERAIWLIEDMAQLFDSVSETGNNRYAQASWRVLRENYAAVAQQLAALLGEERIKITALPPGIEATNRGESVIVDEQLDGLWDPAKIAQARRIGGDDWSYISRLASALVGQDAFFRSSDEWQWLKDQRRRSAVFGGAHAALSPDLTREIVHFGFLKDKYLLTAILAETSTMPELAARWRSRQESVAQEADAFLLTHAAAFGNDSALSLARDWREYAESARKVSAGEEFAGASLVASPGRAGAAADVSNSRAVGGPLSDIDPDLRAALEPDMPERIKAPPVTPLVPTDIAEVEPSAGPMPDDRQSAKWRDDLGQRDYQTGGITVPIVSEIPNELSVELGEGDARQRGTEAASRQAAAGTGSAARTDVSRGGAATTPHAEGWLSQLVSRNATLFALLPFIVLLALILLAIASLLAASRRRRASEEPIILSVAIDDDAPDLVLDDDLTVAPHVRSANDSGAAESAVDRLIADLNAAERRAWAETKRAEAANLSVLRPVARFSPQSGAVSRPELLPLQRPDQAGSELGPRDLVSNLRGGNAQAFETLLGRFTSLGRGEIATLLRHDGEAQFAVACRAIGLDDLLFASLFILVRRHYHHEIEVSPQRLSHAMEVFASVAQEEAKQQLEAFGVDADYILVNETPGRTSAVG